MINPSRIWNVIQSKMKVKGGYNTDVLMDNPNEMLLSIEIKEGSLPEIEVRIRSYSKPSKISIEFHGTSPLVTRPHPVNIHRLCSHSAGLLDRFIGESQKGVPIGSIGRAKKVMARMDELPVNVDRSRRNKINGQFNQNGLDGNTYFNRKEEGLTKALEILQKSGIEQDEVVDGFLMGKDSGKLTLDLAWTNPHDSMNPTSIRNTVLVLAWHKLESGRFEVTAYLS